jgi:hypothetical protein
LKPIDFYKAGAMTGEQTLAKAEMVCAAFGPEAYLHPVSEHIAILHSHISSATSQVLLQLSRKGPLTFTSHRYKCRSSGLNRFQITNVRPPDNWYRLLNS